MQGRFVLAIFGPTASGKTAVAEELTSRLPAEVISADSMQVYQGLPILTNQPATPTRLVGIWDLAHEASVAEYQQRAHEAIDEVLAAGRTPIVAGGTGLYLRAALSSLELPPPPRPGQREHWQRLYETVGAERAHELLAERDPAAAASVHPNDQRRVVRALELTDAGRSLRAPGDRLWSADTRHPTVVVGLDLPLEQLLVAERVSQEGGALDRREERHSDLARVAVVEGSGQRLRHVRRRRDRAPAFRTDRRGRSRR